MDYSSYRKWQCADWTSPVTFGQMACDYIYDEELGDKEEGFEPGTRLQDIPKDWGCPDCGAVKEKFIEKE